MNKSNEKGISIIFLILIIIVLLGIIALSVWAVLNGKFFDLVEDISYKNHIEQIKDALQKKKEWIISENNNEELESYNLKITDLNIPEKVKNEFKNKLVISKTGELLYNQQEVTKESEQKLLKWLKVNKIYSFTLNELNDSGIYTNFVNGAIIYEKDKFWDIIGVDYSKYYGVDFENGTLIGKMSSNSEELPFVTEYNPKKEGDSAFSFGEATIGDNTYVSFQIGYFDGKKSVKDHFNYEEMLEKYGDVEIYFWSNK